MSRQTQLLLAALGVLWLLRLVAGALLPLSADEAYYWLWSRHLAAGYFDHPPMIAWLIRAGTFVFGNTPLGVRAAGIVLSAAASWFVWRSAAILLANEKAGALACLLFNLSLMVTVEFLAATPDAPQIFFAAVFVWALTKLAETADARWWLAAGCAAGLGLMSKYSTLFLGTGALVWLIATPSMRRWLTSPWPYLGGVLALAIFLPNLLWNAQHGWATFVFQFGRIEASHLTLRYLGEFIGAQALLATPFILALALLGLAVTDWKDKRSALVGAMLWPSIVYFTYHSLHDRVQGNWPCYLYPVLAVAAAAALQRTDWRGWKKAVVRWSGKLAVPVAAVLVIAGYAQALSGIIPFGRKDPLARLLAVGLPDVVQQVEALQPGAPLIATDYATTAWFSFYGHARMISLGEDYRWPNAPEASAAQFTRPALYITEDRKDRHDLVAAAFSDVRQVARIDRLREGVPIAHYVVYRVIGPKTQRLGRMP